MDRTAVQELVRLAKELMGAVIGVGDKVKYSRNWLQSTGTYSGALPHATGVVKSIQNLGGLQIATIDWDTDEAPDKVNVKNLVLVSRLHLEPV